MSEESKKPNREELGEDVTVRPKKKKYRDPRPSVDKHVHGMNVADSVPKPVPKPVPAVKKLRVERGRYEDSLEYSRPPSSKTIVGDVTNKTQCEACGDLRSQGPLSAVCFQCGHVRYGRLISALVLSTLLVCGVSQVYGVVYWKLIGKPLALAEVKSTLKSTGFFQRRSNAQKAKEKKDLDEAFEKGLETQRSIK